VGGAPYCSTKERKVVVVVDFLVTICPCPVLAAAASLLFFPFLPLMLFFPVVSAARHRVCTQGIGRRDCQMGAAVDNIRRRQFLLSSF